MKRLFLAATALCAGSLPVVGQSRITGFDIEPLGSGVYALIQHAPEAMANQANSLVVIGSTGVLVVDAQYTRAATLQTLAAIRRLTREPVRFVVNTHWHDDHVAGNQVYRDSFPDVQFIAHENTRRDLASLGAANRKETVGIAPSYVARLERLMAAGLGFDSTAIAPSERDALQSTIDITRQYVAESPGFREILPTLTFSRRLTVYLGDREVDVRYFGRGNTAGDAVVYVPDVRVVATGDLVVSPVPFAFNPFVGDWITALDSVRALKPAAFMPGHGPVLRDDGYIVHVQNMLALVRDSVRQAVARRDSLPAIRRALRLTAERKSVAGSDKWLGILFGTFFLGPAIERSFAEATRP